MTLVSTHAAAIRPGDLYIFASGQSATVRRVRPVGDKVKVSFTDPLIRYGACEATSQHTVGRWI